MSLSRVFVIQKFDNGGLYDKRYEELFKPALEAARTEPVRADSILGLQPIIEKIEGAIREADICFADVSTDNPNVWLEVGYALALNKPLVMVCDTQRQKLPFDVSHRPVIFFKADVPSDFENLKIRVGEEIRNEIDRQGRLSVARAVPASPFKVGDLAPCEIGILTSLIAMYGSLDDGLRHSELMEKMRVMGFTDAIVGISLVKLQRREFVVRDLVEQEDSYGNRWSCEYFRIAPFGIDWLTENEKFIPIAQERSERDRKGTGYRHSRSELDDEIPF